MAFKVTYSGLNSDDAPKSPWADITPYVSVDKSRNWSSDQLFEEQTVTLNGQLTESGFNALSTAGSPNSYGYSSDPTASLVFPTGYIQVIRSAFSNCYGELVVTDENTDSILSGTYYVDSISFDSQNYIGILNYSINLKQFNSLVYSGINPSETISMSDDGNGLVNVSHTISADGVGNAFDGNTPVSFNSVKTFVQNLTGATRIKSLIGASGMVPTGSGASGVFVSGGGSTNLILISQTESINRLQNSYSINENFVIDNLRNSAYASKRFSVDLNSGVNDDYIIANVTCNVVGAKDQSFANVSGLLNNITGQMYTAATGLIASQSELCPVPISFSIETTRLISDSSAIGTSVSSVDGNSTIRVSCSFDNSPNSTFFDYEVSYSSDEASNNSTTLDIDGIIRGRGLHTAQKFADASGYLFNTLLSSYSDVKDLLYHKATGIFSRIAPNSSDTNHGIISSNYNGGNGFGFSKDKGTASITLNSGRGEISLRGSFSDEAAVSGYSNFNWSVDTDVGVPLNILKSSYTSNGKTIVQELGVTGKTEYNFNGSFSLTTGINSIPILSAASKPHLETLGKLVSGEGFTELSNDSFYNNEYVLNQYNKNITFVSGTSDSANDTLSTGFDVNLVKTGQNLLNVYAYYQAS